MASSCWVAGQPGESLQMGSSFKGNSQKLKEAAFREFSFLSLDNYQTLRGPPVHFNGQWAIQTVGPFEGFMEILWTWSFCKVWLTHKAIVGCWWQVTAWNKSQHSKSCEVHGSRQGSRQRARSVHRGEGDVCCGFVFHKHATTVGKRLLNRATSTDRSSETDGVYR